MVKIFGDFELDDRSMKLRRAGRTVRLGGQALDLLLLLLENPGELVTREAIQQRLWPDSNVEFEHSLHVALNRLRMALGDNSKEPRYIQTVPKKGYRFVEAVRSASSVQQPVVAYGWIRKLGIYAAVALLAAVIALVIVHTRYDKFVRPHLPQAPEASQR